MGAVVNALAAVGIAGSLTLGTMATWNGGSSLTAAKQKILAEADALGVYHTNEGKLLNKISGLNTDISNLNSQIASLQSSGTADQSTIDSLNAQIASDKTQIDSLNSQLTQAGTNENAMAQRIDDLTAQVNQANTDATDLQTTVDGTTYVASDQTAVDNATGGSTTTTTPTTPPPTDTTTTPTTTTTTSTTPTMPAGDTEIDYASVTMPYTIWANTSGVKQVQINVENGNLEIENVSSTTTYQYSTDGGVTWKNMDITYDVLGTTTAMNNTEVQVKSASGTVKKFWFVNK